MTFTKEQLQHIIETDHVQCGDASALARMALAGIEAEPVAWAHRLINKRNGVVHPWVYGSAEACPSEGDIFNIEVMPLYTVPPAPVSVPAAMEMDDDFDSAFEHGKAVGWNACSAAMLQGAEPVSNRDELRVKVRREHAEWSQATFGDVGPVGPLKHLSKEALEAAAEPGDLSEWADMQFLLWDAQRRAGISDGEITAAMEEKLKVNMARQWPEPKDGEPRLHIKTSGNSPVIPDGWVACVERMPENDDFVYIWPRPDFGVELHVAQYGKFDKRDAGWYAQVYEQNYGIEYYPVKVTHWMPLPNSPKE
ncbi:TPA: dATP/dGTP pyrophosphohydrolase domain-containing protein [Enterobacter ludwigii]